MGNFNYVLFKIVFSLACRMVVTNHC